MVYTRSMTRTVVKTRKRVIFMANKITKRDRFNQILAIEEVATNKDLADFINHELELLAKKNAADRKPTKVQTENEGVKEIILANLTETPTTISDLQKASTELGEISNQKISALIRQLVADGLIVRTEEKRKAYFAKA